MFHVKHYKFISIKIKLFLKLTKLGRLTRRKLKKLSLRHRISTILMVNKNVSRETFLLTSSNRTILGEK